MAILSCKERIERRVGALLALIQSGATYNTTPTGVHRKRGVPCDPDKAPELFHWIGDLRNTSEQEGGNGQYEMRGPLAVSFSAWKRDTDTTETVANYVAADIRKALINQSERSTRIYVNSGTVGHAAVAVQCSYMGHVTNAVNLDGEGVVGGCLVFDLSYREMRHNPNLFYDTDTEVAA